MQVSRLLGHHSPSFTLSVYAHLMDESTGGPLDLDGALGTNGPRANETVNITHTNTTAPDRTR